MAADALRRWMYRGYRPNWLARVLNQVDAAVGSSGIAARTGLVTLEVRGRTSGRLISLPIVVVVVEGQHYLVSMLGEHVQWVCNVRAAGGKAVIRSGHREPVHLEEIAVDERPRILQAYLQHAPGARAHVPVDREALLADFERLAPWYPVFRVSSDTVEQPISPSQPDHPLSRLEVGLFALSAAGVPIALLALWRLGRLGGLLLEAAVGALGLRAGMMVAAGTGRRLRPVPRVLLYGETALDALAVATGFWTWVWRPFVRHASPQRVSTDGRVAPVAVAAWLGASIVHTARMAIYISPGRGRRDSTPVVG